MTIFLVIHTKKKQKRFTNFVKLLVVRSKNLTWKYRPRHSYLQSEVFLAKYWFKFKKEFKFFRTTCTDIMYISEAILMYTSGCSKQVILLSKPFSLNLCFSLMEKSKLQIQYLYNIVTKIFEMLHWKLRYCKKVQ